MVLQKEEQVYDQGRGRRPRCVCVVGREVGVVVDREISFCARESSAQKIAKKWRDKSEEDLRQ